MHTWVDSDRVRAITQDCILIAEMAKDTERHVAFERARQPGLPASRPSGTTRFRYSYLMRLLDDSELAGMDKASARELRTLHRKCFWRNVSLLSRDAHVVFRNHRRLMSDRGEWDFSELTGSMLRTSVLVATLRTSYFLHFLRMPGASDRIASITSDLAAILAPLAPPAQQSVTLIGR